MRVRFSFAILHALRRTAQWIVISVEGGTRPFRLVPKAQDCIGQGLERPEANHHMTQMQPSASKIAISNLTKPHHIATQRGIVYADIARTPSS